MFTLGLSAQTLGAQLVVEHGPGVGDLEALTVAKTAMAAGAPENGYEVVPEALLAGMMVSAGVLGLVLLGIR